MVHSIGNKVPSNSVCIILFVFIIYSDSDKDSVKQYRKQIQFLQGFLNTKEIVILYYYIYSLK